MVNQKSGTKDSFFLSSSSSTQCAMTVEKANKTKKRIRIQKGAKKGSEKNEYVKEEKELKKT